MKSNYYKIVKEELDQQKELERYKKTSSETYRHHLGRRFYENGINVCTGTEYDPEGYDINGFNERGFSNPLRGLVHKETKTAFDKEGYSIDGYNINGFNKDRIHKETKTIYDPEGYDFDGYDKEGYNRERRHRDTGTRYNLEGYSKRGFSKDKNDRINIYTNTEYDLEGYDRNGFDKDNYNREGKHKDTGTRYDLDGFTKDGYDREGYNREGYNKDNYNRRGFNKNKNNKINCKTGTIYDERGFDINNIHKETNTNYDENGFDINNIHKDTNTIYDSEGYDINGRNKSGLTRETKQKRYANYHMLSKNIKLLLSGELLIERFRAVSKCSIYTLYYFARNDNYSYSDLNKLARLNKKYHALDKKSEPHSYFKNVTFNIDNNTRKLEETEIDKLVDFLNNNKLYVCEYTLRKYAKLYLSGKIDLDITYKAEEIIDIINKEKEEKEKEKQRKEMVNKMVQKALILKNQENKG